MLLTLVPTFARRHLSRVPNEPDATTLTDEEAARQMEAAADAIRAAVLGLLRAGEVHPRIIVVAAARVTGELAAGAALAAGEDVGAVVGDLAEVVREAGRGHGEMLRTLTMPAAGSA